MVKAQATRIRMILRKTPLKVYSNLKQNRLTFISKSAPVSQAEVFNVFFLESVNRSLYNGCFRAISRFINGILFSFLIFLHARCISEFCSISEWRVQYLKGQTWLTLKAAMGIFNHGGRISVKQQVAKALVFT